MILKVGSISAANPSAPRRNEPRSRGRAAGQSGRGRGAPAQRAQGGPPSAHLRWPQSRVGTARSGRAMGTTAGQQLRALFYVLSPGESSFRTVEEVPDYVEKVRAPSPPLSRRHPLLASPCAQAPPAFFRRTGEDVTSKEHPK